MHEIQCSHCLEDMKDSQVSDVTDKYGKKAKKSTYHVIECMTKPKQIIIK